jgi:hypothetical protein
VNVKNALKGLQDSSDDQKSRAAGMLFSLTSDDDARAEIVKLGGVPLLCKLLKSKNVNVQKNACGALLNLAGDGKLFYNNIDEARDEIIKCGAAPDFVQLLVNGTDILKEYAAGVFVVKLFFKI